MPKEWFSGRAPVMPPVTDLERAQEQRERARLTAARHADSNAEDLRYFLDVLGLWPAEDAVTIGDGRIRLPGPDPAGGRYSHPGHPSRRRR